MKESIEKKLAALAERFIELDHLLADPDVVKNMDNYRSLSRERAELDPVVAL